MTVVGVGNAAGTTDARRTAVTDSPPPAAGPAASSETAPAWQRWSVLLPVLTFVVGLVLGAVALSVTQVDDEGTPQPLAGASPEATPAQEPSTEQSPGSLRVIVPAPCVLAAEKSEVAYDVLDEAVAAVRDFDARRLADIVDRAQAERAETEELVEACEDAAGADLVERVGSPGPSPDPSPSS